MFTKLSQKLYLLFAVFLLAALIPATNASAAEPHTHDSGKCCEGEYEIFEGTFETANDTYYYYLDEDFTFDSHFTFDETHSNKTYYFCLNGHKIISTEKLTASGAEGLFTFDGDIENLQINFCDCVDPDGEHFVVDKSSSYQIALLTVPNNDTSYSPEVSVDFNNLSVTWDYNNRAMSIFPTNGDITISNLKINRPKSTCISIANSAKVTLDNITVNKLDIDSNIYAVIKNSTITDHLYIEEDSEITINDSKFVYTNTESAIAIDDNSKLTLSNVSFDSQVTEEMFATSSSIYYCAILVSRSDITIGENVTFKSLIPTPNFMYEDMNHFKNLKILQTPQTPYTLAVSPMLEDSGTEDIEASDSISSKTVMYYSPERRLEFGDGTVSFFKTKFTQFPTAENPSVKANYSQGLSYQWYETTQKMLPLTAKEAMGEFGYYYNTETGCWFIDDSSSLRGSEYDIFFASTTLNTGKLRIIPQSGCTIPSGIKDTVFYAIDYDSFMKDGDPYYFKLMDDGSYYLDNVPSGMILILTNYAPLNFKMEYEVTSLNTAIQGQTTDTYTSDKPGTFACKATWNNGLATFDLISNPVTFDAAKVTYETNGGTAIAPVSYRKNYYILSKPSDPKKSGYKFAGWYKDKGLTTLWNFEKDVVSSDMTLYAKWEDTFKVTDDQYLKNSIALGKKVKVTPKKTSVSIQFGKVKDADGYDILAKYCGGGKPYSVVKTVKKSSSSVIKSSFTKVAGKKLSSKKDYQIQIKAYKKVSGEKVYIGETLKLHVAGVGQKYTNPKSLKLSASKITLKKGKSTTIKGTLTKANSKLSYLPKKHGNKLRFISSNPSKVTVSANGKIKGIKKGSATVYVVTLNGIMKPVKVTVK